MRINIIDPYFLTDNHLIAEYREIKMSTHYYRRSKASKNGLDKSKISKSYTLNKGHAYMWYNKFGYISKRFEALLVEMRNRGFTTQYNEIDFSEIPTNAFGDYSPSSNDIQINLERILLRISDKPKWYKHYGANIDDWVSFYGDVAYLKSTN